MGMVGSIPLKSCDLWEGSEYEKAFNLLIDNYPKNKQKYKIKIIELFNALGHTHEKTIEYRKKLSQIMFC